MKLFPHIIAALGAVVAIVSCNKAMEEDFIVDPNQEREVFLTVSMGLDTRATSVSPEAITSTWQEGDEMPLVYKGEVITTLKVTSIFGNKAMLSGKVKGAYPVGAKFDLYYGGTSYVYYGQDGTAASAASRAYLKATDVAISQQDNNVLTLAAATLQHQQAYFQLQFQWGPDLIKVRKLTVENLDPAANDPTVIAGNIVQSWSLDHPDDYTKFSADSPFTVYNSDTEGATTVFFALRDNAPADVACKYRFTVTDIAGRTYTAHAKEMPAVGPVQNGHYYSGLWLLDKKQDGDGATTVAPTAVPGLVYDAQAHDLVTPAMLQDGVSGEAGEGTVVKYFVKYFAPHVNINVAEAAAVPAADAPAALADASQTESGWATELPNATETGTYYIFYQIEGGTYYQSVAPAAITDNPVKIAKRAIDVTAPTAVANLKYTGSAQALVNAGSVKDKNSEEFDPQLVMQYYVTDTDTPDPALTGAEATGWSTEVPQRTNADTYYVWYKVDGSAHFDSLMVNNKPVVGPIAVTIATTDAVIANPEPIVNLIYNGEYQQLVLPADASDGCKVYYYVATSNLTREAVVALDNSVWVAPADLTDPTSDLYKEFVPAPKKRDAGTYYIWTKVVDNSGGNNYSGVPGISEAAVVARIGQAPLTVTVPALADNWTFDGTAHQLFKATPATAVTYKNASDENADALSETPKATLYYKATGGSWTAYDPADTNTPNATLPKASNAGEYHLYYYVDGGQNFKSQGTADQPIEIAGSVTVDKVTPSFTTAVTAKTSLVYNGAAQALVNAGAVDFGELQYCVNTSDTPSDTWTTTPPVGTDARVDPDYYYVFTRVIGNENINTISAPASGGIQVEIAQAPLYVTLPSYVAGPLSYSGSYQRLLQDDGLLQYRNANDELEAVTSSSVARMEFCWFNETRHEGIEGPVAADELEGKDAGEYYAYYKVYRGANFVQNKIQLYNGSAFVETSNTYGPAYGDYFSYSSYIIINKVDPELTHDPVVAVNLAYTGSAQSLVLGAATYDGGNSSSYLVTDSDDPVPGSGDAVGWVGTASLGSDALKRTDAGTYYVWTRIAGDDNHTAVYVHSTPVEVTIAPGANPGFASANRPVAVTGLVSNNTDHTLVDASSVTVNTGGTLKYSIGTSAEPSDTWVDTPPTGKLAGTYYVWYKIDGGGNYADSDPVLLTVHIAINSQAFTVGVYKDNNNLNVVRKVYFSPGNLQATTSDYGATWTWDFAPHQHVVLGSGSANVAYVNEYSMSSAVSKNGSVDLFGWSTSETENYYGINSSTYSASFQGTFVDWGTLPIAGDAAGTWRTLTKDEWVYLLGKEGESSRTNAVNLRTIRTVNGVNGLVILPDGCSVSIDADWGVLEAAGAVFLPVEGTRNNRTVSYKSSGYYWSSTRRSGSTQSAHGVLFYLSGATINVLPEHSLSLQDGFSVRLVKNAQ